MNHDAARNISEESRRAALQTARTRQSALEHFHNQQLALLHEQLGQEAAERQTRERSQISISAKLDAESRAKQAEALLRLKQQLDHNEEQARGGERGREGERESPSPSP